MTFQFSVPCYDPTPKGVGGGGGKLEVKTLLLKFPVLHNRKSPRGKDPNVKTLSFPVISPTLRGHLKSNCPAL